MRRIPLLALTACSLLGAGGSELDALQGTWQATSAEAVVALTFDGTTLTYRDGSDRVWQSTVELVPDTSPRQLRATILGNDESTEAAGTVAYAIYALEGEGLTMAWTDAATEPPASFDGAARVHVLTRAPDGP